jgi:hypothetical protein
MKLRIAILALIVPLLMGALALAPVSTAAPPGVSFPVTGSGETAAGVPVNFTGTLAIQKFEVQGGDAVAIGTLSGTVTDAVTGASLGTVSNRAVTLPLLQIDDPTGTCEILHLELGPLDLDLLGLVIHLDRVVLDITAEQGPGNLLGNLLCAIVGLFDNNAPLNILVDQLNVLLDVLNWLG